MNKPEKMKGAKSNAYGEGKVDGYNIACDDYEAYHKQEMDKIKQSRSVEKIRELLYTRKAYSETWGDWCNKVAKKISKSIIGK